MNDLVTPCHGARPIVVLSYTGGYLGHEEVTEFICGDDGCQNSWTPEGIADEWNKDAEGPDPVSEMFPGTLAALNALTIRKATP